MHTIFIILRILGAILGGFLVYVSVFTYADTENQVRSKLYDLYFQLYDVEAKTRKFDLIVIKTVLAIHSFFAKYFDGGKLSFRFFGSCGMAFLISGAVIITPLGYLVYPNEQFSHLYAWLTIFTGLILLGFWMIFPKLSQKKYLYFFISTSLLVILPVAAAVSEWPVKLVDFLEGVLTLAAFYAFFCLQVYVTILFNKICHKQVLFRKKRLLLINLLLLLADILIKVIICTTFGYFIIDY